MNPQQASVQNGYPGSQPQARSQAQSQPALGYVAMPSQMPGQMPQGMTGAMGQIRAQTPEQMAQASQQLLQQQAINQQLLQQQMLQQQMAQQMQQPMQPQPGAPQNPEAKGQEPARKENPNSTQATLLISELRDGVVIMKDGSFRAVVACKSINFDLMSDTEREGVEYSYQNFLNSLTFTTQILIRSQRVDIGPYLDRLIDIRRNNDNMLLGVLMDNYINFVDVLAREANIMDKSFFIVIPYYSSPDVEKGMQQTKNFFKTFSKSKVPAVTRIERTTYDKAMTELNNRVETVMAGLFNIGIQSVRLKTKELAELYYNYNNPDTAVREPLVDFSKVATLYVKKGDPNEKPKQY